MQNAGYNGATSINYDRMMHGTSKELSDESSLQACDPHCSEDTY